MNEGAPTGPEELGVLIKETQAILNLRMDEVLRPLGLSVPQYACLQALHNDPGLTSSELARRAFVSRQSMNVLLQGLERRGLVHRSDPPGPRRERAVVPSADAAALVERARAEVARVAGQMTADLTAPGLHALRSLLTMCRDALLMPREDTKE